MPPGIRNVNQAGTGVNDFLSSIPPITRAYAGVVVVTVIVAKLGLFNVAYLALLWPRILKRFEVSGSQPCGALAAGRAPAHNPAAHQGQWDGGLDDTCYGTVTGL